MGSRTAASDLTIELKRHIHATPEQVWTAWTQADELARWWWPASFNTNYHVDAQEGGSFRFVATNVPGRGTLGLAGTFLEVQPPSHLVYTWSWEHELGQETRVEVKFVDADADTEIHLRHSGFPNETDAQIHVTGWTDCLNRLVALLGAGKGEERSPPADLVPGSSA